MNDSLRVNIVIPVYNEELILESSIRTLHTYLKESAFPYNFHITIVNNSSTDHTQICAEDLAAEFSEVSILSLPQKGKGRAVQEGWCQEGDIMAFMDADLSSDLSFFRPLIDAITVRGCDVAVGSRLGKNSKVYGSPLSRRIVSRTYNALARLLCGTSLPDHQCGFKAVRRKVYERIAPYLQDTSWFFDTEFLALATHFGYSVCSVDIHWHDHPTNSKVSLFRTSGDMLRAMWKFRIRLSTLEAQGILPSTGKTFKILSQATRFLVSGGIATGVNLIVFYILYQIIGIQYLVVVVLATAVAFCVSFTLQKFWTFKDKNRSLLRTQAMFYGLSTCVAILVNLVLIYLLVEWLHLWPPLGQFISLAAISVVNFFIYKYLIFRK